MLILYILRSPRVRCQRVWWGRGQGAREMMRSLMCPSTREILFICFKYWTPEYYLFWRNYLHFKNKIKIIIWLMIWASLYNRDKNQAEVSLVYLIKEFGSTRHWTIYTSQKLWNVALGTQVSGKISCPPTRVPENAPVRKDNWIIIFKVVCALQYLIIVEWNSSLNVSPLHFLVSLIYS